MKIVMLPTRNIAAVKCVKINFCASIHTQRGRKIYYLHTLKSLLWMVTLPHPTSRHCSGGAGAYASVCRDGTQPRSHTFT